MRARQSVCIWLVSSLLPICSGAALSGDEYSHRVYRTEDGLPHNRIQAISQTTDGYLWIGTSEGLARFDGARFVVFDRSNTPAFRDNSILALESSPDGSLWIATEGGGLLHYAQGAFRAFGQNEGLTNGFVRAVRLDSHGVLWAGTDRGFFRYSSDKFVRLDATADIPLASVIAIAEDASGRMWAVTSAGLLVADQGKLSRAHCAAAVQSPYRTVALLHEGLIRDGCGLPDIALPNAEITSMRRDASGNLWLGTVGQGLLKLTHGVTVAYNAPAYLPVDTVFAIYEDRQHSIWVGGLDGLVRLGRTAAATLGVRNGLADENITSTFEDRSGQLWITTYSGRIYRMKGSSPEPYLLPSPPGSDVRVRTVFEDEAGDYWFGTSAAGVIRQSRDGAITRYTRQEGLRSDAIRQIIEAPRGIVWIATGSGISRWDGKAFTSYYLSEGLAYPSVRCLALDSNGDILAGTDAGVTRIHNGVIVADAAFAQLSQERVWSILVDKEGILLGTRGGGLARINAGKVTRFTVRDGLGSNSIYQIVDDRNGSFWMSSPAGVFSVRRGQLAPRAPGAPRTINSVIYGTSDGMQTSQMSGGVQPVGCRRSSGDLWFPSVRGVVRIDPLHLPEQKPAPALIEKITAGDLSILPALRIAIPPGHGRVQIDYTACNLTGSNRLSFTWMLEGFDESWSPPSKLRSAFYSSLPPGHYRFRVIAADSAAPGVASEASVAIDLAAAFYQTGWFYSLLVSGLACVVWAGLWMYTNQTKKRFALLLNERTRLAREMHDTVIQGCIGVSVLAEAAARCQTSGAPGAKHLLDELRGQVKATIDEARQAIWDLRNPMGDASAIAGLFDLARKLGQQHAIKISTASQGLPVPLGPAVCQAMLLVGREALRNAITHAGPRRISVSIVFHASHVTMEISDDGKGFDPERLRAESDGHFGIVGMRERIVQLRGEFSLRSSAGQGTSVVVVLPSARRQLPDGSHAQPESLRNRRFRDEEPPPPPAFDH